MGTYGVKENSKYIELAESAKQVDRLDPYCYPIFDINKDTLVESFFDMFKKLDIDYDTFIEEERAYSLAMQRQVMEADEPIAWDINLSHLPELTDKDRLTKYRGMFEHIFAQGINPADYTTLLSEIQDLYIGEVVNKVYEYHKQQYNKEFRGRVSLIWIGAHQGYNFHIDAERTPVRYHVPLITNPGVLWLFKDPTDGLITKMHMPVGSVWQFFPVMIEHTVINQGDTHRCHMIITEVN